MQVSLTKVEREELKALLEHEVFAEGEEMVKVMREAKERVDKTNAAGVVNFGDSHGNMAFRIVEALLKEPGAEEVLGDRWVVYLSVKSKLEKKGCRGELDLPKPKLRNGMTEEEYTIALSHGQPSDNRRPTGDELPMFGR